MSKLPWKILEEEFILKTSIEHICNCVKDDGHYSDCILLNLPKDKIYLYKLAVVKNCKICNLLPNKLTCSSLIKLYSTHLLFEFSKEDTKKHLIAKYH